MSSSSLNASSHSLLQHSATSVLSDVDIDDSSRGEAVAISALHNQQQVTFECDSSTNLANQIVPGDHHQRRLTFVDGIGVSVGIIIGSGIFSSPGVALARCGSTGEALLAWTVAGFLVICTSLCYIELGCAFPTSGGDFEYLTRAYGEQAAFSFAWFNFFISKPGSQAIIATIFGRYCEMVFYGNNVSVSGSNGSRNESSFVTGLAVIAILVITTINCIGIKESSVLQNILTGCKLLLVLSLSVIGIAYALHQQHSDDTTSSSNLSPTHSFEGSKGIFAFGSSLVACLWSFDGWADLNFMMEDLQNPQRTLPRVVITGLTTVLVAYLLANISYLVVLSKDQVMHSPAIAYEMGQQVANILPNAEIVPVLLAIGVALSTIGSLNGSILTGGKAFYAVARDGKYLPPIFATLSSTGAPIYTLLAQGIWGIILLLLPGSNFGSLLSYFGPASWFYYMLSTMAVVILRHKGVLTNHLYKQNDHNNNNNSNNNKNNDKLFSVPWYPIPIVVVVTIALVIICGSFINEFVYTSLSFGFIGLSIPAHMLMKRYVATNQQRHLHQRLTNFSVL